MKGKYTDDQILTAEVCRLFREERKAQRLTQLQASFEIGGGMLSPSTIAHIERAGKKHTSIRVRRRVGDLVRAWLHV